MLDPFLYHSVGAVWSTATHIVALIDGLPRLNLHLPTLVVGKAMSRYSWAATTHRILQTVGALAPHCHCRHRNALTHLVVVDVGEVIRRALQVHTVADQDAFGEASDTVDLGLPPLQALPMPGPLLQVRGQLCFKLVGDYGLFLSLQLQEDIVPELT